MCVGLERWHEGPFHYPNCCKAFASSGLRDIALDDPLMHVVCGGNPVGLKKSDQEHRARVSYGGSGWIGSCGLLWDKSIGCHHSQSEHGW